MITVSTTNPEFEKFMPAIERWLNQPEVAAAEASAPRMEYV